MSIKMLQKVTTQSYVVEGAALQCTMGTQGSHLKIPVGHGVWIRGKKQANIGDVKPGVHICGFGSCNMSSPPVPCVPMVAMDWLYGKKDVEIDGLAGLMDSSVTACSRGGMIKITDDGQM